MSELAPPKGMRDFYPEDYRARRALFEAWQRAADRFGFEFYDAPVVETLELLQRKAGEEISEQIYAFEDKSGRGLALRPEMTPSLARMIIARQNSLSFPIKWGAIAQCFRYEAMQKGRRREHYQWNLDIIGEPSIMAEAEVIGAAIGALRDLGLTSDEVKVRVGSRAILTELFAASGLAQEHFLACCLALDKRGKISDGEVTKLLEKEGLKAGDIERVFGMLQLRTLDQAAEKLSPESAGLAGLRELFKTAESYGVADWLIFDLGVIRGLGYYTGIVFEAFDTSGKSRAIFGGGRYERLLADLGGQAMPCVGLGMGDVVVMDLLQELGKAPATQRKIEYAVGFMDEASRELGLRVASSLRGAGRACDLALSPEKPKKFFTRANKIGAERTIYVGPDEAQTGSFKVKTMASGEELPATLESLTAL